MNARERDILLAAVVRFTNNIEEISHAVASMGSDLKHLQRQVRALAVDDAPKQEQPKAKTNPFDGFTDEEILQEYKTLTYSVEVSNDGSKRWHRLNDKRNELFVELKRRNLEPLDAWANPPATDPQPPPAAVTPPGPRDWIGGSPSYYDDDAPQAHTPAAAAAEPEEPQTFFEDEDKARRYSRPWNYTLRGAKCDFSGQGEFDRLTVLTARMFIEIVLKRKEANRDLASHSIDRGAAASRQRGTILSSQPPRP